MVDSVDWRATFRGAGAVASLLCLSAGRPLFKEPPKMVLRMMRPSLEPDILFQAALSKNSRTIAIARRG